LFLRYEVAPSKMKGIIQATLDYARVTGKNLKTAAFDVAKAIQGNLTMLRRYGVNIDTLALKTRGVDAVAEAIEKRMGGAEAAYIQSFAGKMTQIKNTFGDLYRTMGLAIIRNKHMKKSLEDIKKLFVKLTKDASDVNTPLGEFINNFGDFISRTSESLPTLINVVATVSVFFMKLFETVGTFIGDYAGALADAYTHIYNNAVKIFNRIKHLDYKGAIKAEIHAIKDDFLHLDIFTSGFAKTLKKDIKDIWDDASDAIDKANKKLNQTSKSSKNASKNADDLAKSLGDADEVIKKFSANKLKDMHLKPFRPNLDFLDQYKVKVSQMQQYVVDRATKALEELRAKMYNSTMDFIDRALGGIGQVSDAFVAMMNGQEAHWNDVLKNMLDSLEHFITEALIKFAILEGINALTGGTASASGMLRTAFGFQAYASGGLVTSPTLALVGEREPEYIIPESKMQFQVHVYNATPDTYVKVFTGMPLGAKMKIKEALA